MYKSKVRGNATLSWHDDAACLVRAHRLVMLNGAPGAGKSHWAWKIAVEWTGSEPQVIEGTPVLERSQIWGHYEIMPDGTTKFFDGPLPLALKNGQVLVVEELNDIPAEIRGELVRLRGKEAAFNPFTHERLDIPDRFRLIATCNPESLSCKANAQVVYKLLDDFIMMEVPNVQDRQVATMLEANFPETPTELRAKIMKWWMAFKKIGEKESGCKRLSYRQAEHLMKLLLQGQLSERRAVELAMVNAYMADAELHSAAKLFFDLEN